MSEPIDKNPFANPVLRDGRIVTPGKRMKRQKRQESGESAARITQSSRRTAERDRLAMNAGTNKDDPLYKKKIARQEAIEQAAARARRARFELLKTAEEQQRLLQLGDEAAEIIETNRRLNLDADTQLGLRLLLPHEWPDGTTYAEKIEKALGVLNQLRRAQQKTHDALRKLFERAGLTERQGQAWIYDQLGMDQAEIGGVMGGTQRSNVNELVTKAHQKLRRFSDTSGGRQESGLTLAQRILAEDADFRASRGLTPGQQEAALDAAHGDGTGRARSVKLQPWGDIDAARRPKVKKHDPKRQYDGK